jgi:hypothetical protein
VNDSHSHVDGSAPQDGDVVLVRASSSGDRYIVRQLPGVVQFSLSQWDEAIGLARSFARKYAVDVWYGEDGTARLLEVYRNHRGVREVESPGRQEGR